MRETVAMTELKSLITPALFGLLLAVEHLSPLRRRRNPVLMRLAVNLAMTALVFATGFLLVRTAALAGAEWGEGRWTGLCRILPLPPWAAVILGILLMDLTFYYWHLANHKIPLLWRFHNVHHIDPDLDVSTSFRFHFVEIGYSTFFRVAQVLLLGIHPSTYLIYQMAFAWATMFHHSNLRLPFQVERALNMVFVTPRMHGVHHSAVITETDSNYSVLFSWWDRLHRTLILNIPQSSIVVGVPAYRDPHDNRLGALLRMPFAKQRDYWRWADGAAPPGNRRPTTKTARMLP